jgi:hypothetical protein
MVAMSQVPFWLERKFEFTFPVEQYPNLVMWLRGTPARLGELVRDERRDVLVKKSGSSWRSMTIIIWRS